MLDIQSSSPFVPSRPRFLSGPFDKLRTGVSNDLDMVYQATGTPEAL
jgi:hypothetical protein